MDDWWFEVEGEGCIHAAIVEAIVSRFSHTDNLQGRTTF